MTASDLNDLIAIFDPVLMPDGQGGFTEEVPNQINLTIPANVQAASGSRIPVSDQLADRLRQVFTIRYQQSVTTAQRVAWFDPTLGLVQSLTYFDIVLIRDLRNRHEWLELTCERRELGSQ